MDDYSSELSKQIDLQLKREGRIIPNEQVYKRLDSDEKLSEDFQDQIVKLNGEISYLMVKWNKTIMGPNYKVTFSINHDFFESKGTFYMNAEDKFWNLNGTSHDDRNGIRDMPVDSFTIFRYLFSKKHPVEIIKKRR